MLSILLSLLSAFFFGFSIIAIKRGSLTLDFFTGLMINLIANTVFLWVFLVLFLGIQDFWIPVNLIFVVTGLIVPGLSRYLVFVGIERLGASISATLTNASPLFAIVFALIFLGERPSESNILGALTIVAGVVCLSWSGETKTWKTIDLIYPLLGGFLFAVRDNLVRFGLLITQSPISGATIASTTSTVAMGVTYLLKNGVRLPPLDRSGTMSFAISGLLNFLSYLLMYTALNLDRVSIVSPLVNTSCLFTLLLALFVFRDVDRITARKVWTTALVILGVFLISWEKL